MPITLKTMRDIWDKERKKEKRIEKYKILSPDVNPSAPRWQASGHALIVSLGVDTERPRVLRGGSESPMPSIGACSRGVKKYYFEYLARRRAFLEIKEEIVQIFSDYESRLGEAGFFKI